MHQYHYLCTVINEQWVNAEEIKYRIGKAGSIFIIQLNSMNATIESHNLSLHVKIQLTRCYAFSTLLYGAEIRTWTKTTSNKLEPFELWLYRRILWISHTKNIIVMYALRKIGKEKVLVTTVKCSWTCMHVGQTYYFHSITVQHNVDLWSVLIK